MPPKANEFKALQIIHKAMALGMLLLTVIMIFVVAKGGQSIVSASLDRTLQVVALLVSVGSTYAGITVYKKKLQAIPPMDTAKDRMAAYRVAALLRWALIEAPVLLSVIFLRLTGNYAFLALAIALMFVFAAVRPSTDVITYQLRLTEAELKELQGLSE
jgi:hypothetical protein